MKKTIYFNEFSSAFDNMNRKDQFSNVGLNALYDYLVDFEEDTGKEVELDVIALCCEYTEYEDLESFKEDYDDIESIERLEEFTIVIMIDDTSFIIQNF